MNENPEIEPAQLQELNDAFREMLLGCLEESAHGRRGLFGSDAASGNDDPSQTGWPEAERLRELAVASQAILAQIGERNLLCDEFLDLCSMHGESHPGEAKLARAFLQRIENGEVGRQDG